MIRRARVFLFIKDLVQLLPPLDAIIAGRARGILRSVMASQGASKTSQEESEASQGGSGVS